MMLRFLALLFFSAKLFANDPFLPGAPPDKPWTPTSDEYLIGGLVNPATGQFSLAETDLIAMGTEPIYLTRHYYPPYVKDSYSRFKAIDEQVLGDALDRRFGWIFFPHIIAILTDDGKGKALFILTEPDGSMLTFKMNKKGDFKLKSEGPFTNSDGVTLSSTFDGRNTTCQFENGYIVVNSKDGGTRYYLRRKFLDESFYYFLMKERLPNGRVIVYKYKDIFLTSIETKDPNQEFTYASLTRSENDWFSHTGEHAHYHFEVIAHKNSHLLGNCDYKYPLLSEAITPLVRKKYTYSPRGVLLSQSARPLFSADYTQDDYLRVTDLKLPLEQDNLVSAHKITYKHLENKRGVVERTFTNVIHPDNTRTNYQMVSASHSHWIYHEGMRTGRYWDKNGRFHCMEVEGLYRKTYQSDAIGNPVLEILSGNLSGEGENEQEHIHREYNKQLLKKEVTDSGLTTTYTYLDGTNLITSKVMDGRDGLHLEEHYIYDKYNNLIGTLINGKTTRYILRQSQPHLHRIEWIEKDDRKIHLEYDQHGNISQEDHYDEGGIFVYSIFKEYNRRRQIISETDALGQKYTYTYDKDGRMISSSKPQEKIEYDLRGRPVTHSDALYTTTYKYDTSDNLQEKTDRFGSIQYFYKDKKLIKTVQGDKVTTSSYDLYGREISRTDANGHTTKYTYNSRKQQVKINYPDGTQESFVYYLNGKLKRHTDAEGNGISYEYDSFGRVIKKIYDVGEEVFQYDALHLLSQTDLEGHITYYTYDDKQRKIKEERCGRVTEYSYDSLGRVASTSKGGITTQYKYDLLDRVVEESTPQSSIKYTYDEDGNKTSISAGESTEKFTYDPLKRLIYQEDPLGNTTTIEYVGLEKRTTDSAGLITIETFDQYENLISKEIPNVTCFRYNYDLEGNLVHEEEDVYKNGIYLKTLITNFTYTSKNEVASINKYGEITQYTYTPSGKVKTKQKPDGTIIQYSYDKLGYMISAGADVFTYNKLGYLISGNGFTREVDPFGNVLKETFSNGLSIEKTYDDLDRPLTIVLPTGTIQYTYDLRLKTITYKGYTHTYEYNDAGHVLTSGLTTYERDKSGQITTITAPHIDQECKYDTRGNLTFCTPNNYIYDELSQLSGEFDSHFDPSNVLLTGNFKEHNGFELTYDFQDRLIKSNETQYSYDSLGRRLSKNDETYLYDGLTEIATLKEGQYYVKINDVLLDLDDTLAVPLFDGTYILHYLVDPITNNILNEYEFDPFGNPLYVSEKLYNPYRYALKHYDEETGFIYFGKRYYDPGTKRWITADPAGPIDLVNLYAFVRNNPFRYRDYTGLFSQPFKDTAYGIGHGAVDFAIDTFHYWQLSSADYGMGEIDFETRMKMMEPLIQVQTNQRAAVDNWIIDKLGVDSSNDYYQSVRSCTQLGLEVASIAMSGYGTIKGAMAFNRMIRMPMEVTRFIQAESVIAKSISRPNKIWSRTKQNTSVENAFNHWKEHRLDFPELLNAKQYVEASKAFINNPPIGTLTKFRANGDVIFYNPSTNIFAIRNIEGLPKTMYKPSLNRHNHPTNLEYFYAQKQ